MKAKSEQRERARALRLQGKTYDEIVGELGVSKSSVSLWVRDLPKPREQSPDEMARHMDMMRAVRDENSRVRRESEHDSARVQVGVLSDRELLMIGVALYWAEGTKSKPWRRQNCLQFINSDPGMIRVFLGWLALVGVPPADIGFRVSIHESADVAAAERYWAEQVGAEPGDFARATLKRHTAKTVRNNVGDTYNGCLIVHVRRSARFYQRTEGWWTGIVEAASARSSS